MSVVTVVYNLTNVLISVTHCTLANLPHVHALHGRK